MAVTESWGRPELTDSLISQPGYHLFRQDRHSRRGGGVFLLVKNELKPVEYSLPGCSFEESVWCSVHISAAVSFLFGCIYRSPTSSSANDQALCSFISDACSSFKGNKVILGDFNCPDIDWHRQSSQPNSQFLLDCCNDNFLYQMVSSPTRGDSILDLVLVDDKSLVSEVFVSDPFLESDHNSVIVTLAVNKINDERRRSCDKSKYFDFSKADWTSYQAMLSSVDVVDIFASDDIDTIWENIRFVIEEAAASSIPYKKNSKFFQGTPLRGEVLRAFRARKRIRQQTRSSTSPWSKDLRNRADERLSLAIQNSRIGHERKIAEACKMDARCFWKLVRATLANRPCVSRVFTPTGDLSQSDFDTAECLNNFFASSFTREDGDAPFFPTRTSSKLCRVNISLDDVAKVVRSLPCKSAPGPDGITYHMIKEERLTLIDILTRFLLFFFPKVNCHQSGSLPT